MEIPDEQLYRDVFVSERSKFHGTYKLYWNRYIAELYGHKVYKWRVDDIRELPPLSYIEADDGACVPLLTIRRYVDKHNREYYFCRFPICTVYFYKSIKDHQFKYNNFQGNATSINRSKISRYYTIKAIDKRHWVNLVLSGVNPVTAANVAFKKKYSFDLHRFVLKLMSDKIVLREIKAQLETFRNKVNAHFTDEDFISELKLLIEKSRKGSQAHRENIKFLLELTGRISPSTPTSKVEGAEEADYKELPPSDP